MLEWQMSWFRQSVKRGFRFTVWMTLRLFKNAVRVKTQVGVTKSGKPTDIHQPCPSTHLCCALTIPVVKHAPYNYFWRCVPLMVRCVDLFTSPQGEEGPTFGKQQIKQWNEKKKNVFHVKEEHLLWNVVLEIVIQLAYDGCSYCFIV